MEQFISQLGKAVSLTDQQVQEAVARLIDERIPAETKAEFLTALARKGETVQEIAAFARELRDKSIHPPIDAETRQGIMIDVCGTGGDRLNTFNISTTVALIVAAAGIPVVKHGNRAITSNSGSADVLEALGIRIDLTPEQAAQSLKEHQFCFLFAPHYHPCFAQIAPARKLCGKKGQRTIFNFLGPLLNPARPSAQLVGVPNPGLCEPLGHVLQSLGVQRGMVVSGRVPKPDAAEATPASYLDEFSILGENTLAEFYHEHGFHASVLPLDSFPLQPATLEDLRGTDREGNALIVRKILAAEDRSPRREAVLLNTGAALFVAGRVNSLVEGWNHAADLLDSGAALRKLNDLIEFSKAAEICS